MSLPWCEPLPQMRVGWLLLSDRQAVIAEISAPPVPQRALALVLDQSDSCPDLRAQLEQLPQLLKSLPRHWSLWVYRLSEPLPIEPSGGLQVAHLFDQSSPLGSLVEGAGRIASVRATGSYLTPVVESIEARRQACGLDAVIVLVVCDGELLDLSPPVISESLQIIGLAPAIEGEKYRHWKRVLPGAGLHTFADLALYDNLKADLPVFQGDCLIAWEGPTRPVRAWRMEPWTATLVPLEGNFTKGDLTEGPFYLVFDMTPEEFERMQITCTAVISGKTGTIWASGTLPTPPPPLITTIEAILVGRPADRVHVVFDLSPDGDRFAEGWQAAQEACRLAHEGSRWVDSENRLVVFTHSCFENLLFSGLRRPLYDAIVCFCQGRISETADSDSRIVVLALNRTHRPALLLQAGSELGFREAACPIEISYEFEEGRWSLRCGDGYTIDLACDRSQVIAQPQGNSDTVQWSVLFSGDMSPKLPLR